MSLVTVVSAVVVAITGPVLWDAATAVAFKLHTGARVAAASFIAVIPAVIVCIKIRHRGVYLCWFFCS